jgi:hypothetical protein
MFSFAKVLTVRSADQLDQPVVLKRLIACDGDVRLRPPIDFTLAARHWHNAVRRLVSLC